MYIQCARKMSIPWIGLNHTGPATLGIPTEIFDFRPSEISSMSEHALAHPELIKITVGISTTKLGITFQHPLFSLDVPSKKLLMCSKKWPVCWSRQGLRETGCFPWAHQQVNLKCGERHRTEGKWRQRSPGKERGSLDWNFPLENVGDKQKKQQQKRPKLLSFYPHHSPFLDWNFPSFPNMKILFGTPVYAPSL